MKNPLSPARVPALSLFVILAVLQFTAGQVAQIASAPLGLLFTEVFLFAAPALLVLRASNVRFSFLRPALPRAEVVALVLLLGVANFPLAGGIASAVRALPIWPQQLLDLAEIAERILSAQHGIWRVLVIVAACVAAPVCEELAFRGVIQPALAARWGPWTGMVLTALLFAILHANPILVPALFELGIVFGVVLVRTGSLSAAMLVHAVHNSLTTALLYGGVAERFEPESLSGSLEFVGLGVVLTGPVLWGLWRATASTARAVPEPEPVVPAEPVRFRPRRIVGPVLGWIAALGAALAAIVALRR